MERARGPGGQGQIVLGLVDLDEGPGPSSKCSAEPPPPPRGTTRPHPTTHVGSAPAVCQALLQALGALGEQS